MRAHWQALLHCCKSGYGLSDGSLQGRIPGKRLLEGVYYPINLSAFSQLYASGKQPWRR